MRRCSDGIGVSCSPAKAGAQYGRSTGPRPPPGNSGATLSRNSVSDAFVLVGRDTAPLLPFDGGGWLGVAVDEDLGAGGDSTATPTPPHQGGGGHGGTSARLPAAPLPGRLRIRETPGPIRPDSRQPR